jgi:F-type H+-transporting ATPase subunit delta
VSVSVVGKRYAKALIQLAIEADAVEKIGRDLRDFALCFEASRELRSVFENPSVSQKNRGSVLREIAQQAGMHERARDLLLLLSDRQRLRHAPEVSDAYDAMAEARSGKVRAEVVTASSLPPAYLVELERVLRDVTGQKVVLTHTIDPSLIAGVVTKIGDQVFDGSLKSRLSELKSELLS